MIPWNKKSYLHYIIHSRNFIYMRSYGKETTKSSYHLFLSYVSGNDFWIGSHCRLFDSDDGIFILALIFIVLDIPNGSIGILSLLFCFLCLLEIFCIQHYSHHTEMLALTSTHISQKAYIFSIKDSGVHASYILHTAAACVLKNRKHWNGHFSYTEQLCKILLSAIT